MKSDSEDTIGWTRLILYTSKSKIYSKSLPDENTYNSTDEDFLNIPLKTEFIDEGINIRFQKALIHLVKLNGGNAIVKKEAF